MDISITLETICPKAKYAGSLTDNTKQSYDALSWHDNRQKPTWDALVECWDKIVSPELLRKIAKAKRDADLQKINYDFGDGRTLQVRPDDIANITLAIQRDYTGDWVMADNSVATVSADELQRAFEAGIQQGEAIWQDYINTIKKNTQ